MKCVIPGVNIKGNDIVHFLKSYLYHMIMKINNCDDLKNVNNYVEYLCHSFDNFCTVTILWMFLMGNDCAVTLSIEVRGKGHSDLRV